MCRNGMHLNAVLFGGFVVPECVYNLTGGSKKPQGCPWGRQHYLPDGLNVEVSGYLAVIGRQGPARRRQETLVCRVGEQAVPALTVRLS